MQLVVKRLLIAEVKSFKLNMNAMKDWLLTTQETDANITTVWPRKVCSHLTED